MSEVSFSNRELSIVQGIFDYPKYIVLASNSVTCPSQAPHRSGFHVLYFTAACVPAESFSTSDPVLATD